MDLNRPDFDEYIHELAKKPIEEIVEEVAGDPDLRNYLATCAGNYRNESGFDYSSYRNSSLNPELDINRYWENTQVLKDWDFKDYMEFDEEVNRKTIAYWTPYILRALIQRMDSAHAARVQKKLDQEAADRAKRAKDENIARFLGSVPAIHKGASIDDFTGAWKSIIEGFNDGCSFLIFGGNGIGKSRLSYAFGMKLVNDGKNFLISELFPLLQKISKEASTSKYTAEEIIQMDYVNGCDVLIIDECDKVSQQDTSFRNFTFLINKRYEALKQTVLFCNAATAEEVESKLGSSVTDRFCSKKWKAEIADFSGARSKRAKEITA